MCIYNNYRLLLYRAASVPILPRLQLEFLLQAMNVNGKDIHVPFVKDSELIVSMNLVVLVKNVCSAHTGKTHVNTYKLHYELTHSKRKLRAE